MTRRNKLIILAVYLLLLSVALPLYRAKRSAADRRLKAEINGIDVEKGKIRTAASEMDRLKHLFPANAETVSFIEELYAAAKQSGLISHEVVTATAATGARTATRGGAAGGEELATHRLKIDAEAKTYRALAEYFRRVQNIERFKRFAEMKIISGKNGIQASAVLELFSLKDKNVR